MAKEINDAQYKAEVEDHKGAVIVDFWAPWCGPCVMMAPTFEKISKKYPGVKFVKVNTTESMQKASELGVTGIPCFIIYKDGKIMERLTGFKPEPAFEEIVKKYA